MIFRITREFLRVNDDLYEVLRKIKEEQKPVIETWREHLGAEKVFRKDGYLFFCVLVPEAEIVEDQEEPKTNKDESRTE
jgi:hypothetical protein